MTAQEFQAIMRVRIPLPVEFIEFIETQGWKLTVRDDSTASLRADKADPLAVAMARMLSREPYRTNVLAELRKRWQQAEPAPEPARTETPEPKRWVAREWLWKDGCHFVEEPADEWYWGHSERNPAGAWWWRHQGESGWKIVEGILHVAAIGAECLRQGDGLPPGEHLEGMLSGPRRPDTVTGALVGT